MIALLVGLGIGAIPAQSQPGQRTTIQGLDLDRDDRGFEVDNNAKGFSKGDAFGFASPLLDPESRDRIGNIKVVCDNLLTSQKRETATLLCRGVAKFEGGQLTVAGAVKFGPNSETATLVITGGTETYEGAAGHVGLEFQNNGVLMTFDFVTG